MLFTASEWTVVIVTIQPLSAGKVVIDPWNLHLSAATFALLPVQYPAQQFRQRDIPLLGEVQAAIRRHHARTEALGRCKVAQCYKSTDLILLSLSRLTLFHFLALNAFTPLDVSSYSPCGTIFLVLTAL